jgi:hypothetical protein
MGEQRAYYKFANAKYSIINNETIVIQKNDIDA